MKKIIIAIVALIVIATLALVITGFNAGQAADDLYERYSYTDSKRIEVNGLNIHYRETGDKSKPTLVLIHGVAASLHTWDGWIKALENDFHIIAFDVPGFGITGPFADQKYTKQRYMETMQQLFDQLKLEQIHLAGNSFGGYLSWNYALFEPQRVAKVILIDSSGMKETIDEKSTEPNIGFMLSTMPLIKYFSWYVTPKFIVRASVENVYADDSKVTDDLVDQYYDMLTRSGNRQAFSNIIPMIRKDESNTQTLAKLNKPVLVMWGAQDTLHLVAEAENFASALPNAELAVYPDLGHIPMEEGPQKTAEKAREFLLR